MWVQNMFFLVPILQTIFSQKDIDTERKDRMFLTLTFVACGGVLVALLASVSYLHTALVTINLIQPPSELHW